MTGKLVLENLKHRPMRSLLSILLIGVPVTLILTLVGLSNGMLDDTKQRTRGIGADVIIRPKGSTMLTLSGTFSEGFVDYFAKQPHVTMALGMLNQLVQGVTLGVTGIDLDQFNKMSGGFDYIDGGPFQGPDDILIDQYYANQIHARVGGHITVLNRQWRVAGIIESGKLARIVLPLKILQDLTGNTHKISQVFLKLDDPANSEEVVKYLKSQPELEGWPIYSMQDWLSLWNVNNLPGLSAFITVVIVIGVVIGFAVVCLSMYMAVLQRTREIGILKSLGASKGFILGIILSEALLMGVGGTILGILMSFGAWWLIETLVPASITMEIVVAWWPISLLITLTGAALGALYPGLAAARHDPIEALAYE